MIGASVEEDRRGALGAAGVGGEVDLDSFLRSSWSRMSRLISKMKKDGEEEMSDVVSLAVRFENFSTPQRFSYLEPGDDDHT